MTAPPPGATAGRQAHSTQTRYQLAVERDRWQRRKRQAAKRALKKRWGESGELAVDLRRTSASDTVDGQSGTASDGSTQSDGSGKQTMIEISIGAPPRQPSPGAGGAAAAAVPAPYDAPGGFPSDLEGGDSPFGDSPFDHELPPRSASVDSNATSATSAAASTSSEPRQSLSPSRPRPASAPPPPAPVVAARDRLRERARDGSITAAGQAMLRKLELQLGRDAAASPPPPPPPPAKSHRSASSGRRHRRALSSTGNLAKLHGPWEGEAGGGAAGSGPASPVGMDRSRGGHSGSDSDSSGDNDDWTSDAWSPNVKRRSRPRRGL